MAKSKSKQLSNGMKRELTEDATIAKPPADRPAKKTKLLDDSDEEAESDHGGVSLKINEDYARRFEHNKKREEQHRLEEKYGKNRALQDDGEDSEDSQEGVEEDDAGELVTEDLDQEISATLAALRSKDPRIYDSNVNFYKPAEADASTANGTTKEPSMTLKQYHTQNYLKGELGEKEDTPPRTYAQEQEDARQNLVKELKGAEAEEEDDDFLVAKSRIEPAPEKRVKITVQDVENADKDPETFLSNFMASRAWVPKGDARFQPLVSDDEDEEAAAEEWENSYNMYFEDTTGANEKIVTYARDTVAKTTVRREGKSSRAKAREAARAKREAERKEKEEDLARLRKLKIDQMEKKVQKIRQTGGLKGRDFNVEEWKDVLEADWSDDQWDKEMQRRFGDAYYADNDAVSESDEDDRKGKKKAKKPKFDDDIDIKDLIPDFKDDEVERPQFTLSDDEDAEAGAEGMDVDEEEEEEEEGAETSKAKKTSKQRKQEHANAKSAARRDRRLIENLVNDSLQYEAAIAASSSKAPKGFRYRETSPTTFGMTPRDILLASDKQLNEFAGLKKLAAFRDPAKKKKDKKQLSKKARLRQWRQETFGDAEGPKGGFETIINEDEDGVNGHAGPSAGAEGGNIHEGERKKKRKRKGKNSAAEA
ncbi:Krr1-domain-containing protein [Bimuria novae-zelandiae CBS 107.79]|uniref:Krr1-domain-containing protein n=1 Tax=Bimuria novae-zelandiae CBS 107.79 TaxID=1447943 RepID=A0A6A5URR9_9PLEO|nr:Krr1-domain-containing protein [Bimuria novae-zelandiae CBS 107.79]